MMQLLPTLWSPRNTSLYLVLLPAVVEERFIGGVASNINIRSSYQLRLAAVVCNVGRSSFDLDLYLELMSPVLS
jgi:hypothetical protein